MVAWSQHFPAAGGPEVCRRVPSVPTVCRVGRELGQHRGPQVPARVLRQQSQQQQRPPQQTTFLASRAPSIRVQGVGIYAGYASPGRGTGAMNNGSSDLRRCPDASSNSTSACANMNGQPCKPWTTGPYCRVCNVTDGSRYFHSGQSACVECGDTAATSLATLVGITLAVLLLLCWCGWRQPCKRLRIMTYQALQKIRAPLKQMVAFYQVPRPLH